MISPADVRARNALFELGTALGLDWTSGEAADGTPSIYLPLRNAAAARATIYPFAANWILRWTSPRHETQTVAVDKLSRDVGQVLTAIGAAVGHVIDATVDSEPETALEFVGFLGALGIATEDAAALAVATAGRTRARAVIAAAGA